MKLIFAGTPANASLALAALAKQHEIVLVITREDAPVGRKREITASPVAQKATELGLEILKRNRLTSSDIELIQDSGAERAIVIAYGALVPQALLDALPWWNLHFSMLPQWRGATPLQHSMLSGGQGAGITLFELEAGLDTGPVLASQPREINISKSCGELLEEFTHAGVELILETLDTLPNTLAQTGTATLAPKLSREQAKLDFTETAQGLCWKVMALNPEPMAWAMSDGVPLRVMRARSIEADLVQGSPKTMLPGTISLIDGKVSLRCGGGTSLELQEVQPAGKKVMPATDWYRGLNKEIRLD